MTASDRPLAFTGGWQVRRGDDTLMHVVPRNEQPEHLASVTCPCRPKLDEVTLRVVVHHARDSRERYEALRTM